LLLFLGNASLLCGALSLLLIIPAVIGLPLAIAACALAEKDLARMSAGQMDPNGRNPTAIASTLAGYAIFLCLTCWITAIPIYFLYSLFWM
jgi:hypothetical protein